MKRQAKRVEGRITPAKDAELRALRERIDCEEKVELMAQAKRIFREHEMAQAELTCAAELLRTEREAQGLSLGDMQERTGISRAALCRLEKLQDTNPTVNTLTRIAEALGKTLVIGLRERA